MVITLSTDWKRLRTLHRCIRLANVCILKRGGCLTVTSNALIDRSLSYPIRCLDLHSLNPSRKTMNRALSLSPNVYFHPVFKNSTSQSPPPPNSSFLSLATNLPHIYKTRQQRTNDLSPSLSHYISSPAPSSPLLSSVTLLSFPSFPFLSFLPLHNIISYHHNHSLPPFSPPPTHYTLLTYA